MLTKGIIFNLGYAGTGEKEYEKIRSKKEYIEYSSWQNITNHPDLKGGFDSGEQVVHDWLWDLYYDQKKGVIVDVGANDGVTQSHSLPFIEKGWRAIMIEPNPKLFEVVEKIYGDISTVDSVNCAIHNANEAVRRLHLGCDHSLGHSTLREPSTWTPDEKEFMREDGAIDILARRLTDVLNSLNCPKVIDILHIDAEGLGIEVLESLDFNSYSVKVISLDISPFDYDPLALSMLEFMKDNNFSYVFCESQSVWVSNEHFQEIKEDNMNKKDTTPALVSSFDRFKERQVWKEVLAPVFNKATGADLEGLSEIKKKIFASIVSGSTIVDAGCRIGGWIRATKDAVKNPEHILTIGLDPIYHDIAACEFDIYINCALGLENKELVEFNIFSEPGCNSLLKPSLFLEQCRDFVETIEVPQKSLKTIIKEHQIKEIFYLKTDCQGGDLNIIKGLGNDINKISYIEMEVGLDPEYPFYLGSNSAEDVVEYMNSKGFHPIEFTWFPASPLPEGEILFARLDKVELVNPSPTITENT
jgi:FkbM family methyltransferase